MEEKMMMEADGAVARNVAPGGGLLQSAAL
jgi:hypothetical protein